MADRVREDNPPEPAREASEVPKPAGEPSRAEAGDRQRPQDSQESAYQDARRVAASEHAKAIDRSEPDGSHRTPDSQSPPESEDAAVSGAGGEWKTIDEQPGGAVGQDHPLSCTSACGEMLSGRPQAELIEELGMPAAQGRLAEALGPEWEALAVGPGQPQAVSSFCENGPWAADLWNADQKIHHTVVVDGIDDNNQVSIRDPWGGGSTYKMSWNEFDGVWSGVAVVNGRSGDDDG